MPSDDVLDEHARLLKCDPAYAEAWKQVQHVPEALRPLAFAQRWHSIAGSLRAVMLALAVED